MRVELTQTQFIGMKEQFLQTFLRTGLFDIGDSDERLKWLQNSIEDLEKQLKGTPSLIPAYTLVSLDPEINDTEPILTETENIVTVHWKALRGKYTEIPKNIHRGVILNALYSLGVNDPHFARIIYLSAIHYFPFAKLDKEKSIIEQMLLELGELAEQDAKEEWSLTEDEPKLKLGVLKISDLKLSGAEIDTTVLKASLKTAIQSEPGGHGIGHGANSPWGEHFATKSSEGISKAIQTSINGISNSFQPSSIETPINKFFTEFKKNLDAILKSSFATISAVERRSKLIWWKESLYSHSMKKSYREIEKTLLPIILSYDLVDLLPEVTPISVDYLLRDTFYIINERKDEDVTFGDFLKLVLDKSNKTILKGYLSEDVKNSGRISFTDFISLLIHDKAELNDFKTLTGIDENCRIKLTDLSVAFLHDFLISRLISN